MGQGVWTVLPQILADALRANWSMVGVEPAPIGPAYAHELLLRRLEEMALPGWAGPAGRLLRSWQADARPLHATVGSSSLPAFLDTFAPSGPVPRPLLGRRAAERWEPAWGKGKT